MYGFHVGKYTNVPWMPSRCHPQRHLAWEAFKPPPDPPILPELKASEEPQKQRIGTTLLMVEDEFVFQVGGMMFGLFPCVCHSANRCLNLS